MKMKMMMKMPLVDRWSSIVANNIDYLTCALTIDIKSIEPVFTDLNKDRTCIEFLPG